MPRTRGWGGQPPADDDEARDRILDAARRILDAGASSFGLSDVARDLQVTRQTVYRYFPSADDLLFATAIDGSRAFLAKLERRLATIEGTPADIVVEGVAMALEAIDDDPYVAHVLSASRLGILAQGITSPYAKELGRVMLQRFPVDWAAVGFEGRLFDELIEQMLRTVQTFAVDPGDPPRRGKALRAYLGRWLAPSVRAVTSGS